MEEKFLNSARNCTALLSTAIIGVFILGSARLSGMLFLASMERYNVGRKDASFPFTLTYIVRCLSGPVTGYLGRKYGSKTVTELGCFLCVVGIGGCFFAEDIATVNILWGGVFGLGTGFGSLLLPHILHDFFDKHYDKAHGIYIAGSGIGGFLLPILAEKLLHSYGTSGTFLILSAVVLNCFVATSVIGLLKRKPYVSRICQVYTVDLETEENSKWVANSSPTKHRSNETSSDLERTKRSCEPATSYTDNSSRPVCIPSLEEPTVTSSSNNTSSDLERTKRSCEPVVSTTDPSSKPVHTPSSSLEETSVTSSNTVFEVLRIFIDPPFVIIMITQCLFLLVILTMFTIVVDLGRDVGISTNQEVYVLMNLAIFDTIGRLVFGYITDGGCMSKVNFYASCFVLLGLLLFVLSAVSGFLFFMIALLVIGLVFGGIAMISSGLMISFIEKKDLIIAMPCRYFLYPFLGMAKPFLIEYFREKQGSYKGLLYFMTGICILSTILALLLPASKRFREKRQAK